MIDSYIDVNGETVIDGMHRIFLTEDSNILALISDHVHSALNEFLGTQVQSMESLHDYMDISELNNLRLCIYHELNSSSFDWVDIIPSIAGRHICDYIGPDYCIQSKVNVSIQMPQDRSSILPIHSDCISGDSPWQLNLWIPLTRASDSSSMFIVSHLDTIDYIGHLASLTENSDYTVQAVMSLQQYANRYERHFIEAHPGQILIFHPAVLHGNVLNETSLTRISLNIRFKSLYHPDAFSTNPDRQLGVYYVPCRTTAVTRFSLSMSEQLRLR
jgi:sporadic carbohydrate cluster 2OG-Fe(II) oxygenase